MPLPRVADDLKSLNACQPSLCDKGKSKIKCLRRHDIAVGVLTHFNVSLLTFLVLFEQDHSIDQMFAFEPALCELKNLKRFSGEGAFGWKRSVLSL